LASDLGIPKQSGQKNVVAEYQKIKSGAG